MASAPQSADLPAGADAPWRPATIRVWGIYQRQRSASALNARTGKRERRKVVCYDVRYRIDDRQFRYSLDQKGWAEDFAHQLQADFARGLLFDPHARCFVEPQAPEEAAASPPLFLHAREFVLRQWHRWAPGTRPDAQREIALACLYLLREDAPTLDRAQRLAADDYLRRRCLVVPQPTDLTPDDRSWQGWFEGWSLPLADITDEHLRRFLDTVRSTALDGSPRQLGKSSINRTRMYVRRLFAHAYRRRLIEWDPWEAIEAEPVRDHGTADPDLVMDPQQVIEIAAACGAKKPRYQAFVLVQGLCGLRPGEAIDLRRRDVHLDVDEPVLVFRASHSAVAERFFTGDETRQRPLKGRGPRATRTVPIPRMLVPILRRHLDEHVDTRPDALVFTNSGGGRISLSNFGRDIWGPVREELFEEGDPLRRVRRHDLRHSAITGWLNAGVPLKTAQSWSGHKTPSVLLNTYLGVIRGDEALARTRWDDALPPAPDPAP